MSTVVGTLLGLALARVRFRGRAATETLLLLPMVTPEIIMGLSLLVFFSAAFGSRGSFTQLVFAQVTFCISYVAIVVRARAAGMNAQLEEAARDLGASALGAFRYVTLPLILPAILSGALLAFALSFDDYVVTTFNAGVGSSTLPLYIYGKVKFGVTPEINAISTIIVAVTAVAVLIAWYTRAAPRRGPRGRRTGLHRARGVRRPEAEPGPGRGRPRPASERRSAEDVLELSANIELLFGEADGPAPGSRGRRATASRAPSRTPPGSMPRPRTASPRSRCGAGRRPTWPRSARRFARRACA